MTTTTTTTSYKIKSIKFNSNRSMFRVIEPPRSGRVMWKTHNDGSRDKRKGVRTQPLPYLIRPMFPFAAFLRRMFPFNPSRSILSVKCQNCPAIEAGENNKLFLGVTNILSDG